MFCRACGVQLQPNVKYCHACGAKVEPFLPPQPVTPVEASMEAEAPIPGAIPEETSAPAVEAPAQEAPQVIDPASAAPAFVTPLPPAQGWAPIPNPGFTPPPPPPVSPKKKGSHWVPLGIMAVIFAIGLGVYFLSLAFPPYQAPEEAEVQTAETPAFYMEDGELYFNSEAYQGPAEITVPSEVDGQTVTALAEGCFAGNETLTTVILPDTLEVIGPEAFAGCTALRGIYIPDNVTVIGDGAFRGCTNLEAIDLPGTINTIGSEAFQDCEKLEHIFFDGKKSKWKKLYTEKIGPNTQVYCTNGTLKQGRGK